MKTKVAMVDDDLLVIQGFQMLLSTVPWVEWVGYAHGIDTVLPMMREHRPQVVIMDVMMPGGNGVLLTTMILQEFPDTLVIGCSTSAEVSHIEHLQEAGARGYSLKSEGVDPILQALQAIRGTPRGRFISPQVKQILMENNQKREPDKTLTSKEVQILELKCQGFCNKEVADKLQVGTKTVYKHIEKIKEKAGAKEILQLYPWAVKKGYLVAPSITN